MITSVDQIIATAKEKSSLGGCYKIAVAAADDSAVLEACNEAAELGIADFTLYGSREKIVTIADKLGVNLNKFTIVDSANAAAAAYAAAVAADTGAADLIMKGFISTSALLRTVLSHDFSLRRPETISHIAVLDFPGYHKLLGLTDGGMVVSPTLEQKIGLIKNAVLLFHALGIDKPKVAVSAPVDYIHELIPATTEATQLTSMARQGEIADCEVFGPVTFDAATSRSIATARGIRNYVAGNADIFLADSIEECNIISKTLVLFARAVFAGVIVGAGVPLSLVSRTDSKQNKLASISIACLLFDYQKERSQ